jgi:hypothetical protein
MKKREEQKPTGFDALTTAAQAIGSARRSWFYSETVNVPTIPLNPPAALNIGVP